jgi:predicted small lipoprotein YifL
MRCVLSSILALALMLSLAACAGGGNEETTPATKAKTNVAEPLTWDDVNAIPLADDSMNEEQLRQICLDYMRMMLTFTWTPSQEVTYNNGSSDKTLYAGSVYGGLPYTPACNGNIYTLMEFYDSDNGMLDLSGGVSTIQKISNQCSSSTYWAWNRVCNSIWYTSTSAALQSNGYLRVGPYTYDDAATEFGKENSTNQICLTNGPEVMFESYALAKPADGIVQNAGDGHFRMVVSVDVVRDAGGNIDGVASTITYMDQIRSWTPATQSNGVPYEIEGGVDVKISFFDLFNSGYIPVTFAELNKQDPVEKSDTTFSHTGDSISLTQLVTANVESNYYVSDISAQIGTGEKPVVYTGTLTA